MARSIEALVEPAVLEWARRTAGISLEAAAKRLKVSAEVLSSWESGKARPTLARLRLAARLYKRPLAVFYLPEPPRDFAPLKDYRRLSLESKGASSPLLFAERRSLVRRETALD